MSACVYRHFDGDGNLLYVGNSIHIGPRLKWHMKYAKWRDDICSIKIERFATEQEAADAEIAAIKTEFPKHNFQHSVDASERLRMRPVEKPELRIVSIPPIEEWSKADLASLKRLKDTQKMSIRHSGLSAEYMGHCHRVSELVIHYVRGIETSQKRENSLYKRRLTRYEKYIALVGKP